MGPVEPPHDQQGGGDHHDEPGELAETGNGVQVHVPFDDEQGNHHGQDGQDLGIDIRLEDAALFEQEHVHVQRHGKDAGYANQVDQRGIKVFPGRQVAFAFAHEPRQRGRQRQQRKIEDDVLRMGRQLVKQFLQGHNLPDLGSKYWVFLEDGQMDLFVDLFIC